MPNSITDDINRVLNQASQASLQSPLLSKIAMMNPSFISQEANRRAAIESRYPDMSPSVTDMEARWSGLTAPTAKPAAGGGAAAELQPLAQMPTPSAPAQGQSFDTMGGSRFSVLDQGNGGTVEGNVAALNRQTEALRSLREARNPGVTTGNAGAFGDLVSIGRAGEGFGDDAMRAEKIRGMIGQAATDGGINSRQRMAMIEGAQALNALNPPSSVTRLAPNPQAITPYQQAQVGLEQQRLGLDQQRLGLDQTAKRLSLTAGTMDIFNKQREAAAYQNILGAKTPDARNAAISDFMLLRGQAPQQGRYLTVDQAIANDLGGTTTVKTPFDTWTGQAVPVGGAGGAGGALDPAKLETYRKLRASGKTEQEALAAMGS